MSETQAANGDVLDEPTGFGLAFQAEQLGQGRGNRLNLGDRLARPGLVVEPAGLAIKIPLARRGESFTRILHVVADPRRACPMPLGQSHPGRVDELDEPLRLIETADSQTLADPVMKDDDVDVLGGLPGLEISRGVVETVLAGENGGVWGDAGHRFNTQ